MLDDIQATLFRKAQERLQAQTYRIDDYAQFQQQLEAGGFILAHWDGTAETEALIKEETKATIRCIPLQAPQEAGVCIRSGKPSQRRVLFARAY
jgi:prolyl-tRNA synthetase